MWRALACLIGPALVLVNVVGFAVAKGQVEIAKAYSMGVVAQAGIMVLVTWLRIREDDREGIWRDAPRPHSLCAWGPMALMMGPGREPTWAVLARLGVAIGVGFMGTLVGLHGLSVLRWW